MTLREQLLRDEGVRLMPYRDCEGLLTIGVGRCLDRVGISMAEADMMLDHDISRATASVITRIPWAQGLDEARRGALVNFAFNMGITGLLGFRKMLAAMERGAWDEAARELLDSKYAGQVGIRAERLARQLVTGEWQ